MDAPQVGEKKEQIVLSNCVPINTKLPAQRKASNFEKELQHTSKQNIQALSFLVCLSVLEIALLC